MNITLKNIAHIGVGSNLGDKIKNCKEAINEVSSFEGNSIKERSSFYRTEPWGNEDQNWFINCVIKIETPLTVYKLLKILQDIEKKFERKREKKWSSRTIDLDILFFNDEIVNTEYLQVPHPLIKERRFVMIPLNEVSPELIHPLFKKSINELLDETGDEKKVVKIED
ncbi:MAG: 2-amino-4-hydroxy-6-hydroxymethyldihydropteridine diphosphokinase [Thermodesulfobacteriota bacterium]|nr:2-amino-4-hydroxy-6-hydroxymethyldihydropteridine diphosphokinase [Thermodesulfobacteriota bacterium]